MTSPVAVACHDDTYGCLDCPEAAQVAGTLGRDMEGGCDDANHVIGVVHGVALRGFAADDTMSSQASGGGSEDGYVEFRFEWDGGGHGGSDVQFTVAFDAGGVDFEDDRDNFTFEATRTADTRTYRFTFDGGHRHIPFNVTGTVNGVEESVDGVFTVGEDRAAPSGGTLTFDEAWRRGWPWLLMAAVVGAILGLLFGRPRTQPASHAPSFA